MGDNILPDDNNYTSNDSKIEIKIDIEEKTDDDKIKDMLKESYPSRIYKGINTLIFRSKEGRSKEDTDFNLLLDFINRNNPSLRQLSHAMTLSEPIIVFILNSKEKFEFLHWDESIKAVCDDLGKIILMNEDDDMRLKLYADVIFPMAIKSNEDYLVEHIIDKCIIHYNNNYNKPFATKILSIITTSFSTLHDTYPNYAKKFISTITIYGKSNLRFSSDKHFQSYDYKESKEEKEEKEEVPYHILSPYVFSIIMHMTSTR